VAAEVIVADGHRHPQSGYHSCGDNRLLDHILDHWSLCLIAGGNQNESRLSILDFDADLVCVLARGVRRLPSWSLCLERRRATSLHPVRAIRLERIRRTAARLTWLHNY